MPKGNCEIQQPELGLNSLPQVVALCQHPFYSCGTQLKGTTPYPLFTVALYPNVCFDSSSSPVKWMMVWKTCAGDSAAGPQKKNEGRKILEWVACRWLEIKHAARGKGWKRRCGLITGTLSYIKYQNRCVCTLLGWQYWYSAFNKFYFLAVLITKLEVSCSTGIPVIILLTVHLSIILVINQLNAQNLVL